MDTELERPDRGPMVVRCAGCEITETDEDMIFQADRWWHPFCWEDARDEAIDDSDTADETARERADDNLEMQSKED